MTSSYAHGQFCWVDLVAHDMMAAQEFYADLFGWTVVMRDTGDGPPYAMFFQNGNVVAGIGEMEDEMLQNGMPPTWNSYISVNDVHDVTESAQELGGTVVTPPMEIMGAGWLAFIQDPTGGTLGLWQPGTHYGATQVNEPGTFCWNDLNTHNTDAAKQFFQALFEWTFEEDPRSKGSYFVIKNDGRENGGLLGMTDELENMPPHWMVYFAVEDVEKATERLVDLGGGVHQGPFRTSTGLMTVVEDPQGASFYLIEQTR